MLIGKTNTSLNYRKSRPDANGNLGEKLGTFAVGQTVFIVEIFPDKWAAIYQDESIVFSHTDYITILVDEASPEWFDTMQERLLLILKNLDSVQKDLAQFSADFILPVKKNELGPDFTRRIPDKRGFGWLSPVESNLLWSDEKDHLERGSVWAWDIAHKFGSPVFSIGDGRIVHLNTTKNDLDKGDGGFGTYVVIDHLAVDGNVYRAWYAHLTRNRLYVSIGDKVDKYSMLSHISLEGLTSGPHCHFQFKQSDNTRYKVEDFWNRDDFYYCKFCDASRFI